MNVIRVKLGGIRNVADLSPEMQLLMAAKEESVTNIVRLYSNGAAGNAIDEDGNNLLHIAIKTGNIQVIQAVLLFYACHHSLFSARNSNGKYPRDLTFSYEILKCIEIAETASLRSRYSKISDSERTIKADVDECGNKASIDALLKSKDKSNTSILLSLDGGGVRGLVLIRLLMHLERKIGTSIWKQFDWVCGTSTGAIVMLALSSGNSLEYVQKLYLRLKNKVFVGQRPYNARLLESFLKEELGGNMMSSVKRPRIMATTCLTHVAPPKLKLFRNYMPDICGSDRKDLGYDDPDVIPMWKAGRCSSAAPTYFSPYDEIYSDGGIIANNPTLEMITEFFRNQAIEKFNKKSNEEKIGCVVSLGTGMAPVVKITLNQTKAGHFIKTISKYGEYLKNMVIVFLKQITASDGSVVDASRGWCMSLGVPFFRFSPPMRANVDLDETNDRILVDLLWNTDYYMVTKGASQVNEFIRLMDGLRNCVRSEESTTSESADVSLERTMKKKKVPAQVKPSLMLAKILEKIDKAAARVGKDKSIVINKNSVVTPARPDFCDSKS